MFKNMMNRYYYGKSGQGDYEKEDLPRTRLQLFWEMLRNRFGALIRLNLMYAVVWLPAMYVIFRMVTSIFTLLAAVEDPTLLQTEGATAAVTDIPSMFHSTIFYSLLFLVPCIAITGPFTAGLCYVTRNWARDEHAFIWSDMKDAMKENWKSALGLSAITSVIPFLAWTCWRFYGGLAATNWIMTVPQMGVLMLAIIWFLAITYAFPMLVTYKMSFATIIRNSLLLAVGRLPLSVGIRLLHCVPVLLAVVLTFLLNSLWVPLGLFAYYVLIGFTLSRFVTASFTNAQFDKYINSRIEGAEVNRGLAEEDDEDYEEEEEERELKPWENGYVNKDN